MAVSGNLKTMLPGDLLQWLSLGQKSGTLVVSNKAVEKKIFFKNGRVISSASNDPREYLGQFLMSHGYISEPELMKGMQVQAESGILLGKILVMIDVISEEELQRLMRMKAEEAIYDIFLWRDGEFRFIDDELPTQEMIPLQVDVTGIIMEGTRRVDEWQRIRLLIPNEALVPVIVKHLDESTADMLQFDDAQRTVVAAVDGKRNLADIVLESRSSSFLVAETLYRLVREAYVELREPTPEKAAAVAAGRHRLGSAHAGAARLEGAERGQVVRGDRQDELHPERGLHPLPRERPVGHRIADQDQPHPRARRAVDFLPSVEGRDHHTGIVSAAMLLVAVPRSLGC